MHKNEELTLIQNMRRFNPNTGLVVLWVKLRQHYTCSISELYRVLTRTGQMTDNGVELTNRLNPSAANKKTLFECTLPELGIEHKRIRPFTPGHNGEVERSHRKDNAQLYASHRFYSFEGFAKQLAVRQRQYHNLPMRPLNWLSLKQVIASFSNV